MRCLLRIRVPYAAVSAFALDPVYLSLDESEDFRAAGGTDAFSDEDRGEMEKLHSTTAVDWPTVRKLKALGIDLAFQHFFTNEWEKKTGRGRQLAAFMKSHRAWLDDYALFSVWHEEFAKGWLDWPRGARDRDPAALDQARKERARELLRAKWVQWQLDLQWREARRRASSLGVELMGDLPFMVGVDSADVWSNRDLFRVDQHVGTPPDDTSPEGQDWGLPVYDWEAFQRDDFSWIKARAMRAGVLFSLYRVDHAIGFYRTYFRSADGKYSGFTPPNEAAQVALGERIMRIMGRWGEVVAEDLGTVPSFLRPSLAKLGVPGYRVLRWERDGDTYRPPSSWPTDSVATNATHDTETTAEWYDNLPVTERERLRQLPHLSTLQPELPFDGSTRDLLLRTIYDAPSTLALVLFQDAMGTRERINTPGAPSSDNWTMRLAATMEQLLADTATLERLRRLAEDTGRTVAVPANRS